jgi:hypothetical protein
METYLVGATDVSYGFGTNCIICDECIDLTENEKLSLLHGLGVQVKVCDKCKKAILYLRKQIDESTL